MENHELYTSIEAEFLDAYRSRAGGNEGRARVCARRAAGLAIGQYYEYCLEKTSPTSAYELLQWFTERAEIPQDLRDAARRLTVRVTPEYDLPHFEDPLEDAHLLVNAILEGHV
jgi:hypothetical protein